ncbi:hypothetical protein BDL97_16G022000 [Sphagnum fallax]|nr:hypothetical protein BDL97_16G022000 [Sphagnum fallax]
MEMVTFTIIVDDIVYPDGHSAMACLGGGGPQTAFGAKLWFSDNERVGLAAGIGADFPESCRTWLEETGIDTHGLLQWPLSTLRAWQILEEDGRRTQVWRMAVGDEVWGMLRPEMSALPLPYQKAKVYHAGVHPSGRDVDFIRGLRDTGAEIVSIEVYTHAEDIVSRTELQDLVSSGHIFSPNEKEAVSLVGPGGGTETGTTGVYCAQEKAHDETSAKEEPTLRIKGVNVKKILDPTGCGNTFCGGFLAGWYKTHDLLTAALWGSIAASFMLEYEGVPPLPMSQWQAEAQLRLELLHPHATKLRFA